MAKKKTKVNVKEMKSGRWKFVVVGAIVVLLAVAFMAYKDLSNRNNAVGKTEDFSFYDEDICRCIEKERQTCPDSSWTLDSEGRLCRLNSTVTNPTLRCSMYECAGTTYKFNQEISNWEVQVVQN